MSSAVSSSIGVLFTESLRPKLIAPDVAFDCERPGGEAVSLDSWREELAEARKDSVGKPGIYLDRSQTGAGKSHADREAIKLAGRSLVVTPTHDQCQEVVAELQGNGIDAVAFPRRTTKGDELNCWNEEADCVETAGLSVGAAVCSGCKHRDRCSEDGYLAQIEWAKDAEVAVATHKRAEATGLYNMTFERQFATNSGRQFVSIHEDATDTLFPKATVSVEQLQAAQRVVQHLLNNPKWLNFLGEAYSKDAEGNPVPDPNLQEKREALYGFLRQLYELTEERIRSIDQAEVTAEIPGIRFSEKPQQLDWLLWRAMSEMTVSEALPWRAIVSMATGEYSKLGVLVDDSPVPQPKTLIVTWRNLPADSATCWIADATADRALIEGAAGIQINDWTPDGHMELSKPVTQIEVDIKRSTSAEIAQGIVRGTLHQQSDYKRIGVITHRPLVEAVEALGEPFDARIRRVEYYGSGQDRASNSWYEECDLIIVLGTPRLPPQAVRARLFQLGRVDEAAKDGNWSSTLNWRGWTDDGRRRIVKGSGYKHEAWQQVQRSMVRANLIQAAGRGRGLMSEGCEVLMLSNEECGFPLNEESSIQPIPTAAMTVFNALRKELERVHPLGQLEVPTNDVARKAKLSKSLTRKRLVWLQESGLIQRKGQRGGWWIACDSP